MEGLELRQSSGAFSCVRKKTCGQVTSCEEALFHLLICKHRARDGDSMGLPCERFCGQETGEVEKLGQRCKLGGFQPNVLTGKCEPR